MANLPKLGDILVSEGVIDQRTLERVLIYQQKLKEKGIQKRLGELLIELGIVTEENILQALSKQLGYPVVDLFQEEVDYRFISQFPIKALREYQLVPFKLEGKVVKVATSNPLESRGLDLLRRKGFFHLKIFLASQRDIQMVLDRAEVLKHSLDLVRGRLRNDPQSVQMLVELILKEAIHQRASDIHIEPMEGDFLVRGRVDGVLKELFSFPKEIYLQLVSKIKLMAGMDIAERRLPQDGRFRYQIEGKYYDFRVSTVPLLHGESVVLRILDQNRVLLKLSDLGMSSDHLKKFKRMVKTPYGILLVTGPTGSGKTTTLYSALNELKGLERKIITIEDPVEYELPLIQQIPINPKIGLTFSLILRNILRQDPDIIMVGEIRDLETLNMAIEASMTGHLVFATLHTNDTLGAISRMVHMGADRFLIGDSLIGVVAQRLVRKICPHCRQEEFPPLEELERIRPFLKGEKVTFYRGKGCRHCNFTGYLGREMVSEILEITTPISQMIIEGEDRFKLEEEARKGGFRSLIEDGIQKVKEGRTTLRELLRVVKP